jgi:hypothetical protein
MSSHHNPERAQFYPQHAAATHVGDFIVRVFEYGNGGDDQAVPLSESALKILGLKLTDLDCILDGFSDNLGEVSGVNFAPEDAAPGKGKGN